MWEWNVAWDHLLPKHVDKELRDWTANKALELTGVQDQDLVDSVVGHLRKRGTPQALMEDLEPVCILFDDIYDLIAHYFQVLDEEAELFVKRLWRMLIFYSETERRGIK